MSTSSLQFFQKSSASIARWSSCAAQGQAESIAKFFNLKT